MCGPATMRNAYSAFNLLKIYFFLYFMYLSLKNTSVSYFTMVSAIFPVFMVIAGIFIFNESISLVKIVSGSVILLSIILVHKDKDI